MLILADALHHSSWPLGFPAQAAAHLPHRQNSQVANGRPQADELGFASCQSSKAFMDSLTIAIIWKARDRLCLVSRRDTNLVLTLQCNRIIEREQVVESLQEAMAVATGVPALHRATLDFVGFARHRLALAVALER